MADAKENGFEGFGVEALPFLKALGFHQNREWFQENKKLYESQVREPLTKLVETASKRLAEAEIPLHGTSKASLFRINRDVRFAKEKHPYKTNASAVLTRTGTKKDIGGLYMHFAAEGSFLASGLWYPPGPELKATRERIVARKDDFYKIVDDLKSAGTPLGTEGGNGMLTRSPKGFNHINDDDLMFWLKHKSFVATCPIDNEVILTPELVDKIVGFGQTIMPLMHFVWRAVDPLREAN